MTKISCGLFILLMVYGFEINAEYIPVNFYIPKPNIGDQVVPHIGYTVSYSEKHEQAEWVAYVLTKKEVYGSANRVDNFCEDSLITTGSAELVDYRKSGFDRGHLKPAADSRISKNEMAASFFFSNISPQIPSFNRGIWKKLEEQVRTWAIIFDSLFIVTGPVLNDNLPVIGKNKVSIPRLFYKVIVNYDSNRVIGVGFLIPNKKSDKSIMDYIVPIDSVEVLTGIDFYYKLPNNVEDIVEQNMKIDKWLAR